jgi:hypothetical protein
MLFGTSTTKLLRYLAPLEAEDFVEYGYNSDALEEILEEKAEIVFSYLPNKYRLLYKERVHRLVLVEYAYSGQDSIKTPFPSMENVVAYLNPSGKVSELKSQETIEVTVDDGMGVINFAELTLGDMVVIDFDSMIESLEIKPLVWASNVLASADLMSTIAGDTKTATILPRVRSDAERVFPWLQALNSINPDDRLIIKDLEFCFWEGDKTFSDRIDIAQAKLVGEVTT